MPYRGMEGLTPQDIEREMRAGARFVYYYYAISLLIVTFQRNSPIYFVRAGQSAAAVGLQYTLLTLVAGWWGIPFGPIFSIHALWRNLSGGKDVTAQVLNTVRRY